MSPVTRLIAALCVFGCSAAVHPNEADVGWASEQWPGTTLKNLERGRTVFVTKCGGCHDLPDADAKTPIAWRSVCVEMAGGAELSAGETELLARYLAAVSQRHRRERRH
jgi:hypothetical protein